MQYVYHSSETHGSYGAERKGKPRSQKRNDPNDTYPIYRLPRKVSHMDTIHDDLEKAAPTNNYMAIWGSSYVICIS